MIVCLPTQRSTASCYPISRFILDIYCDTERVVLHTRNFTNHGSTSIREHMPQRHQAVYLQRGWNPDYYLGKAEQNGPPTFEFLKKVMDSKLVIDQLYTAY